MAEALNTYINIDKVAQLKGLKSNKSLRIEINKPDSKYVARKIKTQGGFTYEILASSLEPEIKEKLIDEEIKCTSLVAINNNRPKWLAVFIRSDEYNNLYGYYNDEENIY